ncbi:hypothetical protein H5410_002403, partial [Solanum commersonii]
LSLSTCFLLILFSFVPQRSSSFSRSLIPPKFGEFSSLTHIDFSHSNFLGLIPSEISYLSKLYVLCFYTDYPYGLTLEPHNFELLLKNLTQLRELNLDSVDIFFCISLNFSSYLTSLWLPLIVMWETPKKRPIPKPIWNITNIEALDLGNNHLEGPISDFFRFGKLRT